MAQTIIGVSDAKAVKRWSSVLAVDTPKESYWGSKMMGKGEDTELPIMMLDRLENEARGRDFVRGLGERLYRAWCEGQ